MSDENRNQEASVVLIDENALDKECIRLPSDYLKFAHRSADAKRDVDELKAKMDVVEAELAKEVRSNPVDFGVEKVTESAISATVLTLPRYQKALANLNNARHQAELAQAVVWALEHKKRTLTLLVELHGMGYFSEAKVSRQGKEAVEEMTKQKTRTHTYRRLGDD